MVRLPAGEDRRVQEQDAYAPYSSPDGVILEHPSPWRERFHALVSITSIASTLAWIHSVLIPPPASAPQASTLQGGVLAHSGAQTLSAMSPEQERILLDDLKRHWIDALKQHPPLAHWGTEFERSGMRVCLIDSSARGVALHDRANNTLQINRRDAHDLLWHLSSTGVSSNEAVSSTAKVFLPGVVSLLSRAQDREALEPFFPQSAGERFLESRMVREWWAAIAADLVGPNLITPGSARTVSDLAVESGVYPNSFFRESLNWNREKMARIVRERVGGNLASVLDLAPESEAGPEERIASAWFEWRLGQAEKAKAELPRYRIPFDSEVWGAIARNYLRVVDTSDPAPLVDGLRPLFSNVSDQTSSAIAPLYGGLRRATMDEFAFLRGLIVHEPNVIQPLHLSAFDLLAELHGVSPTERAQIVGGYLASMNDQLVRPHEVGNGERLLATKEASRLLQRYRARGATE